MDNVYVICDGELYHHGIRGMKWGIRRFQKKDGSLTTAGKKRYSESEEDAAARKAEYEAEKQKALKTGSASEVLKYKGDLTQQEMQNAISRIRWENDMRDLSAKELATGKSKADAVFEKVDKYTDYAVKGAKAYNMVANLYTAFGGVDSISLPKIDTNITSGNKETRKKEQKEAKKEAEAKKKREEQEAQRETKHKEREKKRKESSKDDAPMSTKKNKNVEIKMSDIKKSTDDGKSHVEKLLAKPEYHQITMDEIIQNNNQMSMYDLLKK